MPAHSLYIDYSTEELSPEIYVDYDFEEFEDDGGNHDDQDVCDDMSEETKFYLSHMVRNMSDEFLNYHFGENFDGSLGRYCRCLLEYAREKLVLSIIARNDNKDFDNFIEERFKISYREDPDNDNLVHFKFDMVQINRIFSFDIDEDEHEALTAIGVYPIPKELAITS